jgi:plasmid replication initiation protein
MHKKGELIAVRPERIIEARFALTSRQNDILDMLFTQIQDDNNTEYIIDINKYKMLYNIQDKNNVYGDLKKAVKSFEGKGFLVVDKEKNEETFYPWFSKIHYKNKEGKIHLKIDSELKNIFLEVKKRIYYHIKYTLNFNCIYSKRFYYYLKSYEDTGWRIDNLDILREKLQCPDSYKKYSDFRRFALEPAYREINENSDISFEFEEIKNGKKVTALKSIIRSKGVMAEIAIGRGNDEEKKAKSESLPVIINIIKSNLGVDISEQSAAEILENANLHTKFTDPIELINEVALYAKTQTINKGVVGWFKSTVKTYERPVQAMQTDIFNNYEQREYDYDSLEKKLLGWDKVSGE